MLPICLLWETDEPADIARHSDAPWVKKSFWHIRVEFLNLLDHGKSLLIHSNKILMDSLCRKFSTLVKFREAFPILHWFCKLVSHTYPRG